VIVPAFNERERLPVMLDEAVTFLHSVYGPILPHAPSGRGWEILIVDDSSTDSTPAVALAWTASRLAKHGDIAPGQIRVVTLERNRGKGGAVAHGMRHIRGRYAVFADADGASKFSDLAALMAALRAPGVEREEYGMAVGSRAHMSTTDGIVVQRSFVRNMLMYSFHLLLRIVGVRGIKDTQCGFKLFSRPAVRALFSDLKTERWIFDIEVLLLAGYKGVPIVEVPISWHEVAGTKMDLVRDSIRMAWDLVVVRLGYAVGVYQVGSLGPGKA
jgi:dolichyl-phosphate beta-glucosyltransferase